MRVTPDHILDAITDVVKGLPFDMVVNPDEVCFMIKAAKLKRLSDVLEQATQANADARNIQKLAALVATTQDAANPRPLTNLLSNVTHAVMENGGNPAYQKSPLVRLVIHHLLWLLDQSSLPHYDRAPASEYGNDLRAVEDLAAMREEHVAQPA